MKKTAVSIFLCIAGQATLASATTPSELVPKKVVTGNDHSCVLFENGSIKCWGGNDLGQLGMGSTTNHGDQPDTMGANLPLVRLGTGEKAADICASYLSSCALTQKGQVVCWGAGNSFVDKSAFSRELPTKPFIAKQIGCSDQIVCALNTSGDVKCAEISKTLTPLPIDFSSDTIPTLNLPPLITQIHVGSSDYSNKFHACAVANNKIYCWGQNDSGQLGQETSEREVPLPVAPIKPLETELESPGVPLKIYTLALGMNYSCALYEISTAPKIKKIKCWGRNEHSALGISLPETSIIGTNKGDMAKLSAVDVGFTDIEDLGANAVSNCVKRATGDVKCWGYNKDGHLGIGDRNNRGSNTAQMGKNLPSVNLGLPALSMSHGIRSLHQCVILINHTVKCWGRNDAGQLGYEDSVDRGKSLDEMGENLPFVRLF